MYRFIIGSPKRRVTDSQSVNFDSYGLKLLDGTRQAVDSQAKFVEDDELRIPRADKRWSMQWTLRAPREEAPASIVTIVYENDEASDRYSFGILLVENSLVGHKWRCRAGPRTITTMLRRPFGTRKTSSGPRSQLRQSTNEASLSGRMRTQ